MMSKAATPAANAREMVEEMRRKGDEAGADVWLRIIVAARLANRQLARDTKAQGPGSERHTRHAAAG